MVVIAVGETAKLIASLELKDKFSPTVGKVTKSLTGLDSRIDRSSSKATQFGQHLGIGIQNATKLAVVGIGLLTTQVAAGLGQLAKLEDANAQTNAVLKSTAGVAGITGEAVRGLAEEYENLNATIDDKVIQSGANLLLTFTNIRKKAFEPALLAALDMNTRLGGGEGGLQNTIKLLGKALNDPIKGLGALSKAGVTFSKEQTERIKGMVEANDLLGAQDVILKELGKRYGGAFAAQGKTATGTIKGIGDAVEDLQKGLATASFPALQKILPRVREFLTSPAVAKGAEDLGESIAGLFTDENITAGANTLKGLFQTAKDVAPAIAAAASVTGQVVKTAVAAFTALPKELQTLLVGGLAVNKLTGGLVTNLAGGLISSVLKQLVSGVVNVNGGVVNVVGGGGLPGVGGGKAGGLGTVGKVVSGGIIIGGVALALESINQLAQANATAAEQGLTKGEIEARNYYTGDAATQQQIFKRLGRIPSREDWLSGQAKESRTTRTPTSSEARAGMPEVRQWHYDNGKKVTTAVEKVRAGLGADLSNHKTQTRSAIIESGLAAKNSTMEVKAQVASAAMIQQALLLSGMATTRITAAGTQSAVRGVAPPIVSALRSMPTPQTFVTVNVSATHVTKSTTIQKRYGPGNGSSGQQQRSGELEF